MKALSICALLPCWGVALGQSSFYNGDPDQVDGWSSQHGGRVPDARAYEDFALGPATRVNSLFGVFLDTSLGGIPADAYWEIRTGVVGGGSGVTGTGGTLIASGTSAVTRLNLGFVADVAINKYTVDLTSTNLSLNSGTYWLTIAPDLTGLTGQTYAATTGGVHQSGGFLSDGLAAWDSTTFGVSWVNGLGFFQDGSTGELSYGLDGTPVPEPAGLAALICGGSVLLRRRCVKDV